MRTADPPESRHPPPSATSQSPLGPHPQTMQPNNVHIALVAALKHPLSSLHVALSKPTALNIPPTRRIPSG
ncbi:hypothetical protein BC826DRAFT_112765 [Russula brevipes]|nr:hypothetical protein BC826DRAFT_112765 [Russula brevipes]